MVIEYCMKCCKRLPNVSVEEVCFGFSLRVLFLCPISLFVVLSSLFFVSVLDKRDGDFNCLER